MHKSSSNNKICFINNIKLDLNKGSRLNTEEYQSFNKNIEQELKRKLKDSLFINKVYFKMLLGNLSYKILENQCY